MRNRLPLIGLISDSHGRAQRTAKALQLLIEQGVDIIIHLGDVEDHAVLDALVEKINENGDLEPPIHVVFGNVDADTIELTRYAQAIGLEVDHPVGRLELGDKTIVFTHGDRPEPLRQAVEQGVDYLAHGHTHRRRDERIGNTRVINPGALHRAKDYSAAILNTESDSLTFVQVPSN